MPFLLAQLLSSDFIQALCWTLVHSLWQGLVLAIAAGLVVQLTRRSAPALRYNLLAGLFVLFLGASGGTFWYEWGLISPAGNGFSGSLEVSVLPEIGVNSSGFLRSGSTSLSLTQAFAEFCTAHASTIVLVWFLVFALKSLQILSGMHYVVRLRKEQTSPVSAFWLARITELSRRLQIGLPVSLLESGLVKVPAVIGFLKPLVLVPTGMLAQLPPEQVEAILLHELAHIRRRDYLVNLLQTMAEVLFFFNPGLLWLSARLRQERENCCDDLAIQALQSKTNFLQALVTFQEYNLSQFGLAPGFADKRTSLTDRVKRIIYQDNVPLQRSEKVFVGFCLVLVSGLLLGFARQNTSVLSEQLPQQALEILLPRKTSGNSPIVHVPQKSPVLVKPRQKLAGKPVAQKTQPVQTTPKELNVSGAAHKSSDGVIQRYDFERNGVVYEIERDSVDILALKINGEKVSAQEVQRYKNLMQNLLQQYEQGALKIVVNGIVPEVETEPTYLIPVGFIKNGTITTTQNGTEYVVKVKNHKTVQFLINEEIVADHQLPSHTSLIQALVKEAEADRVYAELSAKAAEQLRYPSVSPDAEMLPGSKFEPQEYHYTYLPKSRANQYQARTQTYQERTQQPPTI
ncbi:M56 family metallopeptidase [Rufibacter latericius]|uniref:M56 family metallopeptidase n=1 Tax=Rufibacter latericius TaxID=2487040 RepID=A0A3M9MZU9_9BACT|nr:M56 family metallopeptidase [Rufibacter latericius]RNI31064.1 M56 family metallopeptidase [Rufibacter latericius]